MVHAVNAWPSAGVRSPALKFFDQGGMGQRGGKGPAYFKQSQCFTCNFLKNRGASPCPRDPLPLKPALFLRKMKKTPIKWSGVGSASAANAGQPAPLCACFVLLAIHFPVCWNKNGSQSKKRAPFPRKGERCPASWLL